MTGERAPNVNSGSAELPRPIVLFLVTSAGLTLLCILTELLCSRLLHLSYPFDWPLMPRMDPFRDFYLYRDRFHSFHSPEFFNYKGLPYLYPAPLASVYEIFFHYFSHPTGSFLAALSSAVLAGALLLAVKLRKTGLRASRILLLLSVTFACAYPLFFDFEQANTEWVVCLLVTVGIFGFLAGRGYAAAVCFGVAASMKLYPIIFLGLFFARKQYREVAWALVAGAVTTVCSLWLLCPDLSVSWRNTQAGLGEFRRTYMLAYEQLGFDHSLFALLKRGVLLLGRAPGPIMVGRALSLYLPGLAILGIVLYFVSIRRLPAVNQVICFTVATILLPPVSFDYTLLHLYAPWALLVVLALEVRGAHVRGLSAAFVCCAILFAPESEFIVNHQRFGGQLKALALLALMGVALRSPFASSYDDRVDGNAALVTPPTA